MEKQLPKNWIEIKFENIGEATDFVANGSFQSLNENVVQKEEPDHAILVRLKDYSSNWKGNFRYVTKESYEFLKKSSLEKGDLFIANVGYPGKLFLIPDLGQPMTLGPNGLRIRANSISSNIFLKYYYLSPQGKEEINKIVSGTAQQKFNKTGFRQSIIPLPPKAEQTRIIEKLDILFTQLETIKTSMTNIPLLLKDFRQQVLTHAINGKLTEGWRKDKKLEKIKFEDIEIEREKLKKLKALNDGKKSFTYKNSSIPALGVTTKGINELFKLPNSWDWVSLDQITWNISDGPHFSPTYTDEINGKRFISMRNVTPQKINFEDCKYVSIEDHNEFIKRGKPQKGDLLYTKGGSTGIPCLIDDDVDFSYWVHVALLKTIPKFIDSKYLKNTLLSSLCYNQSQAFTHGVGNQDLGLTRMINITFPLPTLLEQQEIVFRVESLLAKADVIEQLYKELKAKIDELPQSLLHKAFRGELTEQLESDGDARDLLKQMQDLKEQTSQVVKKKSKKNNEVEGILG
ncbi:restriction endonuclease subunit S [Flavobacterium sp. 245]|uniref:restriction endonuclease subunit S n=1 Tax=Flavobacterium sp. 245 TaxID=2512115 RepID=UPI00105F4DB1|nr:restriction endonuclease subunit S [Flavobacterium sp. 245]TDP02193.1 type I restriction enzyme S subunit [Flavobacterium sp. 245]